MSTPDAISEETFEAGLSRLEAACVNADEGLFGPQSMMWRVARESGVFLGAGAALLLQIAHPYVAQGIADHSTAMHDPVARFHRTFAPIFTMVFGTRDDALNAARRVRRVHGHIRGTLTDGSAYEASDAQAALWVHLTLWHTAIRVYEHVVGPLTPAQKDSFQLEANRFATLFAVPGKLHDMSWRDFEARFDACVRSGQLHVTPQALTIADALMGRGRNMVARHLPKWYRAITADLLPTGLADAFALTRDAHAASAAWREASKWYPRLPLLLRHVSPYHEARARIARKRPSFAVRSLNRLWLGRPHFAGAGEGKRT